MVILACLIVGLVSAERPETVLRLGTGDDGSRCVLEAKVLEGRVLRSWLSCSKRGLEVKGVACSPASEVVPGRGFRDQIRCEGRRHGRPLIIDTRDASSEIPRRGGDTLRIAWQPAEVHDEAVYSRSFLDRPVHAGDLQWWRWGSLAALLLATAAAWAWRRRPPRRGRVPRDLDVVQLAVEVPSWPPAGSLRVLPLPSAGLPDADWPADTPLVLREGAPLDVDKPGPGRWWIAGRREGGRGGGLREAEPRLEPSPGRGYVMRRRRLRPRDFAPLLQRRTPPPIGPLWISTWLLALLAPMAAGAPVLPWLTLVVGVVVVGLVLIRIVRLRLQR